MIILRESVFDENYLTDENSTLLRKMSPAEIQEMYKREGFDTDGNAWVVIGDTYPVKDKIKEDGGYFNRMLGWHFPFEPKNWRTVKVNAKDFYNFEERRATSWRNDITYEDIGYQYDAKQVVDKKKNEYVKDNKDADPNSPIAVYGDVGDVADITVTFDSKERSYYGLPSWYQGTDTRYEYTFIDDFGNKVKWTSTIEYDFTKGQKVHLIGKIKGKYARTLVLSRCKVVD